MNFSYVLIGLALGLSIAAFVLAILDAPWEQTAEPIQISTELTQGEFCLVLLDAISRSSDAAVVLLMRREDPPWKSAGCSDYFGKFGK